MTKMQINHKKISSEFNGYQSTKECMIKDSHMEIYMSNYDYIKTIMNSNINNIL